ncbi:MAG: ATP-binding protein [Anaerolineae bacterium]|nr:ATP-binding protein [Anaerolineae bacterium]
MKRALILNAINSRIGGVLIRGERGTAKSTAARALAALLPEINVVADGAFNCDPDQSSSWCTACRERAARGEVLPRVQKKVPFVELPIGATEDRVVGTLDIESAIQKGERRFEPGVLAAANRGILYVDEVNLLDDHIVDVLLDAAAMGVNTVEREGISFQHPSRFILVGTMNPEEGDLRPQLLDRFALCVDVRGVLDARARMQIIERNLAFEEDPENFYAEWHPHEVTLAQRITDARRLLPEVTYTRADLGTIAQMMAELGVDGHRGDLVILKTATAHAAWEGRRHITDYDIVVAAELTLPHRLKRRPFDEMQTSIEKMDKMLAQARERAEDAATGPEEMTFDGDITGEGKQKKA